MLKFFKKVRELTVHTTWMNLKITMLNGIIKKKKKKQKTEYTQRTAFI